MHVEITNYMHSNAIEGNATTCKLMLISVTISRI